MDALRKDTPAHLTQQHTFTFPFELLPDGQERPRFLPPRPSDRQSRSTTKHSQPFEVEGESSPRNGERNRERERIANRAMRRQRETKLKFFRSWLRVIRRAKLGKDRWTDERERWPRATDSEFSL